MTYLAKNYIPVVEKVLSPTKSERVLDLLNARYIYCFKNTQAFTRHTITYKDAGRLDLVCNQYYENRCDLLQALARYNKILNIITDVYIGLEILIPSLAVLEERLENANAQESNINSYITLR